MWNKSVYKQKEPVVWLILHFALMSCCSVMDFLFVLCISMLCNILYHISIMPEKTLLSHRDPKQGNSNLWYSKHSWYYLLSTKDRLNSANVRPYSGAASRLRLPLLCCCGVWVFPMLWYNAMYVHYGPYVILIVERLGMTNGGQQRPSLLITMN